MSISNYPKAFIFGAGIVGKYVLDFAKERYEIAGFLDNDKMKQGHVLDGLPIYDPEVLLRMDYETVIVASSAGINSIKEQLSSLGVERDRIITRYVSSFTRSRIVFLNSLGEMFRERNIKGSAAECGVFMGEFAKEINRVFPDSRLYLFDTFSGFDERDLAVERKLTVTGQGIQYSDFKAGHFNIAQEDMVISNLPHPKKCVIRKGYFPETTEGLDDTFCFVNLDFDLYQPTLAGLEYFYPRMVKGGVILIHDYFSGACNGVRMAVREFEDKTENLSIFPVGDGLSVGIKC